MDAFESLVAMLLKRDGFWTDTSVKVELTPADKRAIGRHSSPRWEIDVVAYRGSTNELLAVECKSFLDSTGVLFRSGCFDPPKRYKLFCEPVLRKIVLKRLASQLVKSGACSARPQIRLCMAVGKIATRTARHELARHFLSNGWDLFDPVWILGRLREAASAGYENDVAFVVSKLLVRNADVQIHTAPTSRAARPTS